MRGIHLRGSHGDHRCSVRGVHTGETTRRRLPTPAQALKCCRRDGLLFLLLLPIDLERDGPTCDDGVELPASRSGDDMPTLACHGHALARRHHEKSHKWLSLWIV